MLLRWFNLGEVVSMLQKPIKKPLLFSKGLILCY